MYKPTQPVLLAWAHYPHGYQSDFYYMDSNGKYIRDDRGRHISREDGRSTLPYVLFRPEGNIQSQITDPVLVERVVRYMEDYYGKEQTNCSVFAHYLTTGEFVSCKDKCRELVLSQPMHGFNPDWSVKIGDTVCLVYGEDRIHRSRKNPARKDFIKTKLARAGGTRFNSIIPMKQRVFDSEIIADVCRQSIMDGYHFMVCVDIYEGEPVWLSQVGWHDPGDENIAFTLTIGWNDPYRMKVPIFAFLRRRK